MTFSSSTLTQHLHTPSLTTLDLTAASLDKLMAFSQGQRSRYNSSLPFPHIIIDNLFSHELLEAVRQEVQSLTVRSTRILGPTAQHFLWDLRSAQFCLFLESLTGVEGLIPDFHAVDGGLREMFRGSFLKVNSGENWHRKLKLERRLNMWVYLNPDWDERWGGQLELWDSGMQNQFVKVPPVFNKTVIFSTHDRAYYGYPMPLECPEHITQRSLCLDYYSSPATAQFPPEPYYSPERSGDAFFQPSANSSPMDSPTSAVRRKAPAQLSIPVKAVSKSIQKSLPKSLTKLYKVGKSLWR